MDRYDTVPSWSSSAIKYRLWRFEFRQHGKYFDVIVTVNYVVGYIELNNEQIQNADMNLDEDQ